MKDNFSDSLGHKCVFSIGIGAPYTWENMENNPN